MRRVKKKYRMIQLVSKEHTTYWLKNKLDKEADQYCLMVTFGTKLNKETRETMYEFRRDYLTKCEITKEDFDSLCKTRKVVLM